jgi:signal transduction histidine kinase
VIIHEKLTKVTVLPIKYENNKFGVIVLESDNKRKTVDDNEKESLSIFAANLGIYLQTKLLEEESVKYHKSRTLNTFAKSIVHELRTPLVGIKGFAAMTKEKYHGDQKLSFYMDNIISDAERVIDLSSQIVDFVEEENAKYAFKSESFTRGIMEVINEFKRDLELNSIELKCFKEDFFIPYDKVKMKKVFRHIIKNSIENIDFNKKEHKISIEKTIERDMIIISFIDNGVGIDQEMLKEAFNPLVSSKIQGTGLGLPLSKNIVEKHGFDLTIDSIEGEYTKVNIIIS